MSDKEKNSDTKWVKIVTTSNAPQAVSWRDILSQEDVVVLVDPPTQHSDPYPTMDVQTPFSIYVREEDEAKAREILSAMGAPVNEPE